MAIERRNPVPKGRYWVDIIDTKSYPGCTLAFTEWLSKNDKSVKVVSMKEAPSADSWDWDGGYQYAPKRRWYLFDVLSPTPWPSKEGFGLPSIVRSAENPTAPVVEKPSDTAARPKPQSGTEILSDWFGGALSGMGGLVVIGVIAFALSHGSKR